MSSLYWCQGSSLLGQLETLGPGGRAALRRRQHAASLERVWQIEIRAQLQDYTFVIISDVVLNHICHPFHLTLNVRLQK